MELLHDEDVGSCSIKKEDQELSDVFELQMPTQGDVAESLDIGDQELGLGKDKCSVKRVCEICFKEFSSGKALGGHMSSHVQKNMSLKKDEKEGSDLVEKMIHGCAICGKRFQSMKALSGHMRRHPERPWRGINPPTSPKTTSTTPLVDLSESLKRWPVTGKRGRKAIPAEVGPLSDGVIVLMMLSRGEGGRKDEDSEVVEVKVMKMRNEEEEEEQVKYSNVSDDGQYCSKSKLNVMMKNKKGKLMCDLMSLRDHKDNIVSTHNNLAFHSSPTTQTQTGILNIDLNQIPPSW